MAINTTPVVELTGGTGISQVAEVLTAVNNGMSNPLPISPADATGIISYGNELKKQVEGGNKGILDDFYGSIVNLVGRSINDNREYNPENLHIIRETFDYGMTLRKLYTFPMEATDNDTWGIEDGKDYSPYIVHKLQTAQKLFNGFDAWQLNPTIPDSQLWTAFRSAEDVGAFLASQRSAVELSRKLYVSALERLVFANYMGEVINNGAKKGIHLINLLAKYNAQFSTTLTAANAMYSPEFLRFASSEINLWLNYIATLGTFFNFESYYRHTPRDRARLTLLAQFAQVVPFYLQADVYHENFVSLPNYSAVPFWQAPGESFAFNDVSSINMVTSSGATVKQTGIIGMISDEDAIAMTINKPSTSALWNPRIEVTHEWYKSNVGYFNNFSENAIVFIVADPEPTPPEIETQNVQLTETGTVDATTKKKVTLAK